MMISNNELKGAIVSKRLDDFNAQDRQNIKFQEAGVHFLTGEIEDDNINEAIKWLVYENLDQTEERTLTLYINSQGGDLYNALGLIDMMRNSHHPVRTIGLGSVMSSAFLIFVSGTQGQRYIAQNTGIMSHQYSDHMIGKHHDLKASMREGDNVNKRMLEIIRASTGLTTAKIRSKLLNESDNYITADEAIELGIADYIL